MVAGNCRLCSRQEVMATAVATTRRRSLTHLSIEIVRGSMVGPDPPQAPALQAHRLVHPDEGLTRAEKPKTKKWPSCALVRHEQSSLRPAVSKACQVHEPHRHPEAPLRRRSGATLGMASDAVGHRSTAREAQGSPKKIHDMARCFSPLLLCPYCLNLPSHPLPFISRLAVFPTLQLLYTRRRLWHFGAVHQPRYLVP